MTTEKLSALGHCALGVVPYILLYFNQRFMLKGTLIQERYFNSVSAPLLMTGELVIVFIVLISAMAAVFFNIQSLKDKSEPGFAYTVGLAGGISSIAILSAIVFSFMLTMTTLGAVDLLRSPRFETLYLLVPLLVLYNVRRVKIT